MAERPPTTDLRGGNTSEDSFTKSTASLVVAYAVDFQSNFLSGAAPVSVVWLEGFGKPLSSLPGTSKARLELVSMSVLSEAKCLDQPVGIKLAAYHWILDHDGSKGWGLAISRFRVPTEDLEPIPRDVVRLGRFRFDLR